MRKHTCHLDIRQRSLYVTIGQKNWVQKLIDNRKKKLLDSQEKKLLDSHEEKFLDKQNSSNEPNQSQNQSVIDQGNLITNTECLLKKAKHPSLERSRRNLLTKNSVLHDRSGQPDKHEIALRAAPEVHREITTLNTDNELTRERIEEDMDFKIPGLPHSTVKQLQNASVRELIQKIENHPNRHALQRDLQQSQSFNPFSQESKQMIHEVGNIELCELLDTEPKTQCKVCLSYRDTGIVYCTCGHFLQKGTEENKKFVQYTMDLLSIPNYYIKKGRPHGHRYGKKPGDREYYIAHSLKKKCKKKNFLGIHDRFIRDEKFRKNMIDNGRTEEICRQMDDLADEDHTHHLTPEEIDDYRSNWWIRSNKIGSDTMPIRHRSDFKQALSTLRQLKDKEDEAQRNQRWTQSYSSSWWNWQESWWNSSYENHHEDVPSTD